MRHAFLILFLASLAPSAPTPQFRAKRRPPLTDRKWVMVWGEGNYGWKDTVFAKDGHYECADTWVGRWSLKGSLLEVRERRIEGGPDDPEYTWKAEVKDGAWEGVLMNNSKFVLKRQE